MSRKVGSDFAVNIGKPSGGLEFRKGRLVRGHGFSNVAPPSPADPRRDGRPLNVKPSNQYPRTERRITCAAC